MMMEKKEYNNTHKKESAAKKKIDILCSWALLYTLFVFDCGNGIIMAPILFNTEKSHQVAAMHFGD